MTGLTRRPWFLLLSLALVGVGLLPAAVAVADPVPDAGTLVRAAAGPDFTATKKLTRRFENADGSHYDFETRTVTVTADRTRNLRGRQRVRIAWKGAQPSGGRAANPYGENGLAQEYPVVVLQCRGTEGPGVPAARRVSPQTCWTVSVAQRSQLSVPAADALWSVDRDASAADRERLASTGKLPDAKTCPTFDVGSFHSRTVPFVAASGKVYAACNAETMPPEAAVGAAFPANEIAAYTRGDGTGEVQFEVRSSSENESLGCDEKTACSIVVVPVNGLSCAAPSDPVTDADRACRAGGRFEPGSSNFAAQGVDAAVGPALWWSASNWANRFTIPITFGLPPDTCEVLDQRAPTGFYGSELLAQAALQWAPAYCLDAKRFKFQHNQMSDEAGWNLMTSGGGAAAIVSSAHQPGSDPVAYAPTAVTGFAVGYVVDRPDNAGEVGNLRLNARLLAKLLTQSYLASDLGRGHPGMTANPWGLMNDPEFVKLNPGLTRTAQEAGATVLNLSTSSDVVHQLTDYIAQDPQARAFVDGTPDPWGMKVNPAYKKLSLPRAEWPLLDEYVPSTSNTCRQENPAVYFSQVAAPVVNLRRIAEALLDGWPNVQTRCDYDPSTKTYKLGRVERQSYGARFMLGIVSLGDADRYGLRTAALQTSRGQFVAPSNASLGRALGVARQPKGQPTGPFTLTQADVKKVAGAYPGTMVVHTAARTANLARPDATKVAQFIRVATSEGQRPGSGNGQLPGGYLPIRATGSTAPLLAVAGRAATAIEKQSGARGTEPPTEETPPAGTPDQVPPVEQPPAADEPSADPGDSGPTSAPGPVETAPTVGVSSPVSSRVLPALLLLGLLGLVVSLGSRIAAHLPRRTRP